MKKIFVSLLALCMMLSVVACDSITIETPIIPDEIITSTTTVTKEPFKDVILFNQDGIKITCKGYITGGTWDFGPSLKFLVENTTDKNITVQVRDCSVNGFMIDPICSANVAAGKKSNNSMTWFTSVFEENDILEVETIEFYFYIFDSDEWGTIVESDVITLNFN